MKPFTTLAAFVFIFVGLAHLYRALAENITVIALGHTIPIWWSWPAVVISFLLAGMLIRESRH